MRAEALLLLLVRSSRPLSYASHHSDLDLAPVDNAVAYQLALDWLANVKHAQLFNIKAVKVSNLYLELVDVVILRYLELRLDYDGVVLPHNHVELHIFNLSSYRWCCGHSTWLLDNRRVISEAYSLKLLLLVLVLFWFLS